MKKSPLRTVFFSLVIIASLASYLFLTCASASIALPVEYQAGEQIEQVKEEQENKAVLPELILIKKVISAGKQLIPAS
jgi:hypothetical protein